MSNNVAYLMRNDRGGRLGAVRVVGDFGEDRWEGDRYGPTEAIIATENAAEWLIGRNGTSSSKVLETLCVDADGAACSWLSLAATDPATVAATLEAQSLPEDDDGFGDHSGMMSQPGRFPDLPGELSVQALPRSTDPTTATRTPVITVPDALARLMMDALDRRGVRVENVCSIWHAAAQVWDPSSPLADRGGSRGDRIVASDAPVTAIVLIDPIEERLLWSWSSSGELLAAGSMRLRTAVDKDIQRMGLDTVGEIDRRAIVDVAEVGRLTQDWLSWSAQLGVAPARVLCVGSPTSVGGEGLTPARLGEAITARWPDTTVDLVDEPDPIGVTLRRLATPAAVEQAVATEGSPKAQLVGLTRRPGSSHRSLYRWVGIALMLIGVGLMIIAYALRSRAVQYADARPGLDAQVREAVTEVMPSVADDPFAMLRLQEELDRRRLALNTQNQPRTVPVLEVFDTLTYVVGAPGLTLQTLSVSDFNVTVKVSTNDLETAERLAEAVLRIEGLPIAWSTPRYDQRGRNAETIELTMTGTWNLPPRTGGAP